MTEFVGDPTGVQIRAMVDEIKHSIFHLQRSNEELRTFLMESPEDPDYAEAISENDVVILKKRGTIKSYLAMLRRVDPAYQQEHLAEINTIFSALALDEVNETPLPRESGHRRESEGPVAPIEVFLGGARQPQMESRLLCGMTAREPQDDGPGPIVMPEVVDVDAGSTSQGSGDGMYL